MKSTGVSGSLMAAVAPGFGLWSAAGPLGRLVRGGADAQRLCRCVYGHLRGVVAPASAADADLEALYARLGRWDDATAIIEALIEVERVKARIENFLSVGGLRRLRYPEALDAVVSVGFANILLAAVFHSLRWRSQELAAEQGLASPAPAAEPVVAVAGREPAGAAVAAEQEPAGTAPAEPQSVGVTAG